jgi:hypothetical protein
VQNNAVDKSVPREITALLSGERLILRETKRAVTPFGGAAVFIAFLRKIDLAGQLRRHMPIRWTSHNQIEPTATFLAFLTAVLVGAKRFAHTAMLRGDQALQALLGMDRFPVDDTIRNLFREFRMGDVQQLYEPLGEWQMERLPLRPDGHTFGPGFDGLRALRPAGGIAERTQPAQARPPQPPSPLGRAQ